MKQHSKILFVFPKNNNLREQQPKLMFTEFYGLIDAYGLMFDPLVMAATQAVPECSNGFPSQCDSDTVLICGSGKINLPGGKINSHSGLFVKSNDKCSEKELLRLGDYETFYPAGLNYTTFPESDFTDWTIANRPVIQQNGQALLMGIELFGMLNKFRSDQPENRLILIADKLSELLKNTLFTNSKAIDYSIIPDDFRLDCHAYGVNRFLVNWLGELFSQPPVFLESDLHYQQAIDCALNGLLDGAASELTSAFQELAKIRRDYCNTEFKFIEVPHIGILFEDEGFFEFEWPDFTRIRMEQLLDFAENNSTKVAFEAGGSCWKNFSKRYPQTIERVNKLRASGKTTVTNGTFSLPYALYSPVGIQYWQFELGLREHRDIFGNAGVPVYQCQENSFTPLTPQLLNHFACESALHVVQNRGKSPDTQNQFFKWRGADGSTISSMGVPEESLGRKGCNYFYDLPLIMRDYAHLPVIYYPNFQDIDFVPLRTQIYRSTSYANIWGEFVLPEDLPFATESKESECFFEPEEYCLAEQAFYNNPTCINSLSQMERIFEQYNKLRLLQQLAFCAGSLEKIFPEINNLISGMLLQEAHDATACQGQKTGDFYNRNSLLAPPAKKRYLFQKMDELNIDFEQKSSNIVRELSKGESVSCLFNPSACELQFAKIAFPENLQHDNYLKIGKYAYSTIKCQANAITKIKPYSYKTVPALSKYGDWEITHDANKLHMEYCGKKFKLSIFDRKRGDFEIKDLEIKYLDEVIQITVRCILSENNLPLHYTDITLLLKPNCPLLELIVNYSSSAEFSYQDKWNDYLGVLIENDLKLGALTHCTPGYRTEAFKQQIVSQYFLSSAAGLSLFNEGTPYYEKINENSLSWMFHNYGESVQCRRMAVYLGDVDPMLMSSSWNNGVIPCNEQLNPHLDLPEQFMAETFIEPGRLLAVSVCATDISELSNIEIPGHKETPNKINAGTLAIFDI